jgi:hypothetical protein
MADRMPEPGDLIPHSFSPQPGRCHKMIYSSQLQATHRYKPTAWKGIWKDRKGKSWYVEACAEHAPKVRPSKRQGCRSVKDSYSARGQGVHFHR